MKPFRIALLAVMVHFLLLFGLLSWTYVSTGRSLSAINWSAFAPLGVLYALLVGTTGWMMGALVNGLLVYPKNRARNYGISQFNTGIIFFALVVWFSWSTGTFGNAPRAHRYVSLGRIWADSDTVCTVISTQGFYAF